jgi:hypothetical protein
MTGSLSLKRYHTLIKFGPEKSVEVFWPQWLWGQLHFHVVHNGDYFCAGNKVLLNEIKRLSTICLDGLQKKTHRILKCNKMYTLPDKNIFLFYCFKCWQLVSA